MATLFAENSYLVSQHLVPTKTKQTYIRNQISRRYMTIIEATLKNNSPIIAFANSNELRGLYAKEKTTRTIVAAVEFDDRLSGEFCVLFTLLHYQLIVTFCTAVLQMQLIRYLKP